MNLRGSGKDPSTDASLTGTISSSLLNLTHIQYLDLGFNDFDYSDVQYHFSKLKNLNHLDVSMSNFSGSITTQFSNLSSLRYLDISGYVQPSDPTIRSYTTSEFPLTSSSINWVRELVNLRVLRLSGVDLSEATLKRNWAKPISFLAHLRELDLSGCYISSPVFPINEFLNLSHLSSLQMNINENLDSPMPTQIANLTSLSVLELAGCYNLQGSIPYLPRIKRLDIRGTDKLHVNITSMFKRKWPKLQELCMSSANVIGSIPTSISNAPILVSLSAPTCSIEGPLPTTISSLSKLDYLDLSMNTITGYLPASVSNLKRLQYLSLFGNKLQGHIPESICELTSLKRLDLSQNSLTKMIPSCITNLQNLNYLDISDNSIEGIVSLNSLIQELNLIYLNLNSNSITVDIDGSPPSKFQLVSLQLQSCNINGEMPDFICKFMSLEKLDLSQNNLKGNIPSCIFKHQTLSSLDLSGNNHQGTLPRVLRFNANYFMYLNLAGNKLHGSLPLPSPKNMYFDLSKNEFNGRIAFEVGERLSSARYASLSGNQLSGAIPLSFCLNKGLEFDEDSYDLESLDLSNNTLTGSIPSSLGNCSGLSFLHLGMNNLSGYVPKELAQVKGIIYLLLHDNLLQGTFPKIIQEFKSLNVLTLGNNNFRGNIPTFIGSFLDLRILSLRSNVFNGSIPKEISNLGKLRILDLSFNSLSGPFHGKILGNLTMLTTRPNDTSVLWDGGMFVSNLHLQIVIKGVLQQIQRLRGYNSGIDLSSNMLEGGIPEDISLLEGLSMLNLSYNHFIGDIPGSIGNMTGLEALDLSFNTLSGEIPMELTSIIYLGYINLSYNNLSGRIPENAHFQSLSLEGSAFLGNEFLCGVPTKKHCDGDPISPTRSKTGDNTDLHVEDDEDGAREKVFLFGSVILGVGVGFWGLFLGLLCRKEKWWFGYWRVVDTIAVKLAGFPCKNK